MGQLAHASLHWREIQALLPQGGATVVTLLVRGDFGFAGAGRSVASLWGAIVVTLPPMLDDCGPVGVGSAWLNWRGVKVLLH